jgi:hypothetical protein
MAIGIGNISNVLSNIGKKLVVGTVTWTLLNTVSTVGLSAITALSTGAYLTYKGAQDIANKEYKKGAVKALFGVGMMLGGGALIAHQRTEPLNAFSASAVETVKTSDTVTTPYPHPTCPLDFIPTGIMALGVWAQNQRNFGFNPHYLPPLEQHVEEVEAMGRQFGQEVREALAKGGKLKRLTSFSGVYQIKNAEGKTIAIFKPDDERHLGPCNPGFPGTRAPDASDEDIVHKELGAIEQRSPSKRQNLAKQLDHKTVSPLPRGHIVEIESDCFVDLEAEKTGAPPKIQKKSGYLQEWVENSIGSLIETHPATAEYFAANPGSTTLPPEFFTRFHDHPLLTEIPLEEFQKVAIMNIRLYNQDGHGGNYLITRDQMGKPHLVPIDMDGILPWQLSGLVGISSHPRAREPFTEEALEYIDQFEPEDVRDLTERMHLSEQAGINAKALTIVLQKFSRAGLTLADIHSFVHKAPHEETSQLWLLMVQAKKMAIRSLCDDDRNRFEYMEYIRRELWLNNGRNAHPDAEMHLRMHRLNDEARVNGAIETHFWRNFNRLLRREIQHRLNR